VALAQQDKNNDFGWYDMCSALGYWLGHGRAHYATLGNDFCGVFCSNFGAFNFTKRPPFADEHWWFMAGLGTFSCFFCDYLGL
jgi:hypothetical protein